MRYLGRDYTISYGRNIEEYTGDDLVESISDKDEELFNKEYACRY